MKPHAIASVVLLYVAAPVMAADLTATQISSTEMQVDGTGFNPGTVTIVTKTNISVVPSSGTYSYEITGLTLLDPQGIYTMVADGYPYAIRWSVYLDDNNDNNCDNGNNRCGWHCNRAWRCCDCAID